jgi:hypothetical protein
MVMTIKEFKERLKNIEDVLKSKIEDIDYLLKEYDNHTVLGHTDRIDDPYNIKMNKLEIIKKKIEKL